MQNEANPVAGSEAGKDKIYPRDTERFVDISGPNSEGRAKARVLLRYYLQYSDGTTRDIQVCTFEKPILHIFKHAGFANAYLDFGSRNDMDLRILWDVLSEYNRPSNSVSYLPEELESGMYETEDGPKMVYFPVLELAMSPIGKEESYMIIGYNPAFFTLSPKEPSGEPSVIQFTFMEETFQVVNDLDPIDVSEIQAEVMAELEYEAEDRNRRQ